VRAAGAALLLLALGLIASATARGGFVAAAERVFALADRGGMPVSVALIDLDGFKQVNDLQGHAAGDELLIDLGRAWGGEMRGSEVLARLGGDEFGLVLAGAGRDGTTEALARLRDASPVEWSVGLVEWRRGETLDQAMAEADEELYRAKRASRELRGEREAAKLAACEPPALRSSSLPSA